MDILIKNMEMKDYPQSITINPDGSVIKDTFGLHRPMDEWKAVALPEHGRLIDAAALFQTYDGFSEDYYERLGEIRDTIINAPTIVEASE